MTKLGFFGGSFNPPTYAHLKIAQMALEQCNLDKIFFVPVGNNYKKPELVDEKNRYEMLKILCRDEKNIFVEDIELNKNSTISAIQAFEMIENKYNDIYKEDVEIYYIMGADNFVKLPSWNNAENLIKKYKYIIFKRDNLDLDKLIEENELLKVNKNNFKILELNEYKDYRSSIIRNLTRQAQYKEAESYTKKEIIDYIHINRLYKNSNKLE